MAAVSPPRLDQLNLVARDVEASRRFYTRLGLDFGERRDPLWAAHHVSTQPGGAAGVDVDLDSISFAQLWNEGGSDGPGVVLGFKVDTRDEVDELVAALAGEGVPIQQAPYDAFWGARYAVVSDPDGNAVGIMSPPEEAYRREPPTPR